MYLFDTNIFLEILLSQNNSNKCKKVLNSNLGNIYISDFSLHSIGVILFRNNLDEVFNSFILDIIPNIEIISLSNESYGKLSIIKEKFNLDFDDAYQYFIAKEQGLSVFTMDKDFIRVKHEIEVVFV